MILDEVRPDNWKHYVAAGELAACMVMQNCEASIDIARRMHEGIAEELEAYPWAVVLVVPPEHGGLLPGFEDGMNFFGQTPMAVTGCQDAEETIEVMRDLRYDCNERKLPMLFMMHIDRGKVGSRRLATSMVEEANGGGGIAA